jgi:hypothetical protein
MMGCGFRSQGAGMDLSGDGPSDDGGAANCRTLPLPCLSLGVTDVSSAGDVQPALANAKSGDTIQIRGLSLGAGFSVPSGVTVRGCMGAQITDTLAFGGGTGTIEGFTVPGAVVANVTGTYVVRANKFITGGSTTYGGVAVLANDPNASTEVTVTIEGNYFSLRDIGVQAITGFDTLTRKLHLTVRNNIFYGTKSGVTLTEGGLVGEIDAAVDFNTFISGAHGLDLTSVTPTTTLLGDIFYLGAFAVASDSPFAVDHVDAYGVPATSKQMPESGSFANVDPMFADWTNSDLHLLAGSPLIDAVPRGTNGIPGDDYFGCPRPVGNGADEGAVESQ